MTSALKLVPRTREEVAATLAELDDTIRAQISADWWAKFRASSVQDPWVHGFHLLLEDGTNVGLGSFKGPPVDGVVEIAYAILPEHQGKGHATAAARAPRPWHARGPGVPARWRTQSPPRRRRAGP